MVVLQFQLQICLADYAGVCSLDVEGVKDVVFVGIGRYMVPVYTEGVETATK